MSASAGAATIFSTDFETDTAGFSFGGTLAALTRTILPTDGGGLSSSNQSMWLGRLGEALGKTPGTVESVSLALTGLSPGTTYSVSFDLLLGASWDGATTAGHDGWAFSVDGVRLVDTVFSNGDQGVDFGAPSPQRYTDASFTDPNGPNVAAFTGAEFFVKAYPDYSLYYGIYYFGHGSGNPVLTFTASSSAATLEWARLSGTNDSTDEYWAIDNVLVESLVPEPSLAVLLAVGAVANALGGARARKPGGSR